MSSEENQEDGTFAFLCPHCLTTLRANAAFEGENRACPSCGEQVTIERANETGPVSTEFPMLDTLSTQQKEILQFGGWDETQKKMLNEWAFAIYTAGEQAGSKKAVGRIKGILNEGRTLVLDDGSRWKLAENAEPPDPHWSEDARVAVIEGAMFNLENGQQLVVVSES